MELPIYGDLSTFEKNYIKDYEGLNDIGFCDYLTYLANQYSEIIKLQNRLKNNCSINDFQKLLKDYTDKRILKYVLKYTLFPTSENEENKAYDIKIEFQNHELNFLNNSFEREKRYNKISNAHSEILNFVKFEIIKFEIKNKAKPIKTNLSNPEKIAVLYKIGIEETLNKFPITEDKYRFIHELIGGNYDNIKKTMIAGVSNDNIKVAQEFINSKTI